MAPRPTLERQIKDKIVNHASGRMWRGAGTIGISIAGFTADGRIPPPFKDYADGILLGLFALGAVWVVVGMILPGKTPPN